MKVILNGLAAHSEPQGNKIAGIMNSSFILKVSFAQVIKYVYE